MGENLKRGGFRLTVPLESSASTVCLKSLKLIDFVTKLLIETGKLHLCCGKAASTMSGRFGEDVRIAAASSSAAPSRRHISSKTSWGHSCSTNLNAILVLETETAQRPDRVNTFARTSPSMASSSTTKMVASQKCMWRALGSELAFTNSQQTGGKHLRCQGNSSRKPSIRNFNGGSRMRESSLNGLSSSQPKSLARKTRIYSLLESLASAIKNCTESAQLEFRPRFHRADATSAISFSTGDAIRGSQTVKAAPPVGRFSALISPPCDSTIRLQIDRPSPIPDGFVPTNGSKIFVPSSAGNPGPVSQTRSVSPDRPEPFRESSSVISISSQTEPLCGTASSHVENQIQQDLANLAHIRLNGQNSIV